MLAALENMEPVDRAFAMAATPRARRTRFASSGGRVILRELAQLAAGVILPRRLTFRSDTGAQVTLLLRRRELIGVVSVTPAEIWHHAAALPLRPDDTDEADPASDLAQAAAQAMASVLDAADQEIELRLTFPAEEDDTAPDGLPMAVILDRLEPLIAAAWEGPDRSTILSRYFHAMSDLPRLLLDPARHEVLPDDTPDHIRKLFDTVGPDNIRHRDGDPPDIVIFEQGKAGEQMTVKVADERRLCILHASGAARVQALTAATWQLKTALDQAAGPADTVH